jgi:PAS domain S-box-containing protein
MSGTPASILLVDDEPALLEIGKRYLEKSGTGRVETCESAYRALEKLQHTRYDAIVSDYLMPGMDGLEFLTCIRERPEMKGIPFIIFTGKGSEEAVIAAIDSGADFYVKKGEESQTLFDELSRKIQLAIGKRKREQVHAARQSFLSQTESVTSTGNWAIDLKTGSKEFSDGFFRIFGVREIENPDYPFFRSIIHPDDRDRIKISMEDFLKRQEERSGDEYRILHPDGSVRWIHEICHLIRGRDGDLRFLGTVQDITDRKCEQDHLKRTMELYRSLIQVSPDVITLIETDGTVIFTSPRFHDLFEVPTVKEIAGENITSWILPEDRHLAYSCMARHIRGEMAPPVLCRLLRGSSEVFSAEVYSAPIHDSEGKVSAIVVLFRDNTDRIAQHEAIERANMKLNLLSSITRHDILNKVTALQLYCSLITDEEDPDVNRSMLKKVREMAEIISDLVSFTGYYQNLGVNTAQWISLGDVFEKAAEMIETDEIRIVNGFGSIRIIADPLFEKVLYNLLDNAKKYAQTCTTIQTGYELAGERLILTISDDGVGIPTDMKEKIFERSYGKGTGLGLYLSREILTVTDLTIRETGVPGYGARFEISVPAGKFQILE